MKKKLIVRLLGISVVAALAAVAAVVAHWPAQPVSAGNWAILFCDPTQVTEGDTFLVQAVGHHHQSDRYTLWWYTDPLTAQTSDYTNKHGVMHYRPFDDPMWQEFQARQDNYSEPDETFRVRIVNDNYWLENDSCDITIVDDDGVGILSLEIISAPADGRAYRAGENIEILARFNGDVSADKPVLLPLRMGSTDGSWRGATLDRRHQNDDDTYVFVYQVQTGDLDTDGISVMGSYSDGETVHGLGGSGSITDAAGDPINPWFRGLDNDDAHRVDGRPYATATEIISTPAFGGSYRPGETIEIALTYNQAVDVDGDVRVSLRMGTGDWWRSAGYQEGSGTDRLVFGYEVRPGDFDDNGISMDGGYVDENGTAHGYAGGGAIKAAGTDVLRSPRYPGLPHDEGHLVGIPHVTNISVTSTPGKDGAYGVGDAIDITVTFSADVAITGGPTLSLDVGERVESAIYIGHVGDNESQVIFTYKVKVGDWDSDGIVIGANALSLNDGSIRDPSGYDVDLSHAALPTLGGHQIRAPGGL